MPITHTEIRDSRGGSDAKNRRSRGQLQWMVFGTDDPDAARAYLDSEDIVPRVYDGLVYDNLDRDDIAPNTWQFTANYVDADRSDAEHKIEKGEYKFAFDVSGTTVTRTQSLNQTKFGTNAPDQNGAINVVGREVKGVDVLVPQLKFSITKRQPNAIITLGYINDLYDLCGKTNSSPFLGFAIGEILFLGASGSEGSSSDPEVTFNFSGSENVSGISLGGISGVNKGGHEYLWAFYETAEDSNDNTTVQNPIGIYVDRVYDSGDFSLLQLE